MLEGVYQMRILMPESITFRRSIPRRVTLIPLLLLAVVCSTCIGCSMQTAPVVNRVNSLEQKEQQAQAAAQADAQAKDQLREQLAQILPPSKARYTAVHSQENWMNPFVIVGPDTVTLRVIMPDANPSPSGQGGLLRPVNARRQILTLRIAELPTALTSLPPGAWPYGRVVGITEETMVQKHQRPQVRRNLESAIQVLNDLGVVVDEWTGSNGGGLR